VVSEFVTLTGWPGGFLGARADRSRAQPAAPAKLCARGATVLTVQELREEGLGGRTAGEGKGECAFGVWPVDNAEFDEASVHYVCQLLMRL
jgi:hypothetical protein